MKKVLTMRELRSLIRQVSFHQGTRQEMFALFNLLRSEGRVTDPVVDDEMARLTEHLLPLLD